MGKTGITGLRFYLTWLALSQSRTVPKLDEEGAFFVPLLLGEGFVFRQRRWC